MEQETRRDKFLLVDDSEILLRTIGRRVNERLGADQTLITAENEAEALAIIAKEHYQLLAVLTDLFLTDPPGLRGEGNAVAQAALDSGVPKVGIYTSAPDRVTVKGITVIDKNADTALEDINHFADEAVDINY